MGSAFFKFFFPFQQRPLDDENDYESGIWLQDFTRILKRDNPQGPLAGQV